MKLLALTTSREDGGAESHLRTTLAAARARGHQTSVALPRTTDTAGLWSDLHAGGAHVQELQIGNLADSRAGSYAAVAADTLAVARLLVGARPDAVLLNLPTPEATPGAMLACALARVPTTAIFHLVRSDLRVTPRRRRMYRLLARANQRWVCVSEDNRATLARELGVAAQRIAIVRNGTNPPTVARGSRERLRAQLGVAAHDTMILTAGRLSEQKQHRLIVEALPLLIREHQRVVFVWAGDGPLRAELEGSLGASGLERHVRVLGRREDVPELLAAGDLFLLPSRDEGAPLALAEAMHAGLPVLVSDAGALTEIVQDRREGLVFARADARELASVLGWALEHREQMAGMAARARERAQRELTLDAMSAGVMAQLEAGVRP